MTIRNLVGAAAFGLAALFSTAADAQTELKVVAPWSNLNAYERLEKPFWSEKLKEMTNGEVTATVTSYSELGLSGVELLRLATLGVFDIGHIVVGYSVADDPVIEGLELATLIQDVDTGRKALEAYRPVMAESLEKKHGLILLGVYPNPSQILYCREPVNSLADIKGRKIRFYGASMNEFVEAAGAVGVSIPLAEVVPALQRGVVDCGITGTLTGYSFKWPEVTKHLYGMRFGWGLTLIAANKAKWEALPEGQRAAIGKAVTTLENDLWALTATDDKAGIDCNTGRAECPYGPAASMTYVAPSEVDDQERRRILQEVVLKKWAARCDEACVQRWNETVGKVTGMTASK
ncbi:TRAP transporter substrate-binding protein [Rhodoligotrophos defluvii]|uniref:TRAP transporter substrate-binding protein n=1 Tax=Rhodoligotrophos defluvii TaxID=2561934 RepID=UPI0010C9FD4B|nr:TRAP transporter substrate-binding protein [Rhodoligotrophos defluvii]